MIYWAYIVNRINRSLARPDTCRVGSTDINDYFSVTSEGHKEIAESVTVTSPHFFCRLFDRMAQLFDAVNTRTKRRPWIRWFAINCWVFIRPVRSFGQLVIYRTERRTDSKLCVDNNRLLFRRKTFDLSIRIVIPLSRPVSDFCWIPRSTQDAQLYGASIFLASNDQLLLKKHYTDVYNTEIEKLRWNIISTWLSIHKIVHCSSCYLTSYFRFLWNETKPICGDNDGSLFLASLCSLNITSVSSLHWKRHIFMRIWK